MYVNGKQEVTEDGRLSWCLRATQAASGGNLPGNRVQPSWPALLSY